MARQRKPRVSVRKSPYKLEGGPMHGQTIWLTSGGTLTFTLHGQTGRYDTEGRWQPYSTPRSSG